MLRVATRSMEVQRDFYDYLAGKIIEKLAKAMK